MRMYKICSKSLWVKNFVLPKSSYFSHSNNFLIKPCPEGQFLYFYNKEGVVSFNCLDFNDADTKKFETQLQINDDLFKNDYEKYAKTALNDNIKVSSGTQNSANYMGKQGGEIQSGNFNRNIFSYLR